MLVRGIRCRGVPVGGAGGARRRRRPRCGPPRPSAVPAGHQRGVLLPVWAQLDGSTPVSGARVSVYAGVPGRHSRIALAPLKGRSQPTDAGGVATLEFDHLPHTFTVVVSGGRVLGRLLGGSLSAQVHGYAAASQVDGVGAGWVVHVNPVTTVIDALQRVEPRISEARARLEIDGAVHIPRWVDGIGLSVDDQWLDGRLFLNDIRAHGTLASATGALVDEIRSGKRLPSFRRPPQRSRGQPRRMVEGR